MSRVVRILIFSDGESVNKVLNRLPAGVEWAIVAAENRPAYHGRLRDLAAAAGARFLIQPRATAVHYERFVEQVVDFAPDVLFAFSYALKLRPEMLRTAGMGSFNLHAALLPEYRGLHTTSWAVANGESEAGVTLHCIDDEIDTGPIVAQERVPIEFTDTWVTVRDRLTRACEKTLQKYLPLIVEGTAPAGVPQDERRAHFYRRRAADDLRIDWSRNAVEIYNLVRSSVEPSSGAWFTGADGQEVRLLQYLTLDEIVTLKREMAGTAA